MAKRARASQSGRRLGKQPPRYRFFLNPYTDVRFTTCPQCRGKTRQRKLPLVIHIDPLQFVALNKACRYCPRCDLLIAHQDELEAWLAAFSRITGGRSWVTTTRCWARRIAPIGCVESALRSFPRRLSSACTISATSFGSLRHRD